MGSGNSDRGRAPDRGDDPDADDPTDVEDDLDSDADAPGDDDADESSGDASGVEGSGDDADEDDAPAEHDELDDEDIEPLHDDGDGSWSGVDDPAARLRAGSVGARILYALKPKSWPKILVAAAFGQILGIVASGGFDPVAGLLGLGFTLFDLAFVVLLNDWGDRDVDALKRRLVPESCSPKTIPDRILEGESVLRLGLGAGALAAAFALVATLVLDRPGAFAGGVACLLLFVAYTLPPVRLNYRGGGEILEMIGVGFALPWWHAYLQSGEPVPVTLGWLPGFALLCLASALASGLADEHTDRRGGKVTFATMFGGARVRVAVEGLYIGAMLVWAAMGKLSPVLAQWWTTFPAVALMTWIQRDLGRFGRARDVDTPVGITRYKNALHRGIWWGTTVLGVTLLGELVVVMLVRSAGGG
jgi:1,4-dihydroxy-2-naphthoate octaprenyltransferase/chlorophyll synthase